MKNYLSYLLIMLFFTSCAQQVKLDDVVINEEKQRNYSIESYVSGINIPWGMTWLPDGSMLITEKSGDLIHFKNGNKTIINTTFDDLYVRGQGGLLDIELHPNYSENGWIYLTYSSNEGQGDGGNTKFVRAKLKDTRLTQVETLYKAALNTTSGVHFGSRIAFDKQGYVYMTIGDRGNNEENPQDITRDGGKIYRFHDDGRIPEDNPFVNETGAKTAIYSYGHRNQQGMVVHPTTGEIWSHEHGPKGGDEINITKKGANYGWPVITYGLNYSGTVITEETQRPGMEQPIYYWTPSIAPSGMAFVTGDKFPEWKGHLLVGALKFQYLELVKLDGNKVVGRQKIATDIGRLRSVKMGPDGYIYMGVEGKGIERIIPN
ncbi:MAG: PQQ-dependent sugar dehydrogenase [Flavobacteriales bacterium]|nr:PQQ-dependent sugar dehydrogenase [Flavobacteriales bacterium]